MRDVLAGLVLLCVLLWPTSASAQVECVNVSDGTRICRGAGSPEGAVIGNVGDVYLRSDGAAGTTVYTKTTGAGTTTLWTAVSVAVVSGTSGTLAKFTGATSLGNSICTESGTTITCVDTVAAAILNATTGFRVASAAAAGTILRGNGTNYVVSQTTYPDLVGAGNILYGTAANTVGSLASVAVGQVVVSGGAGSAPTWSATPSVTSLTASTSVRTPLIDTASGALRLNPATYVDFDVSAQTDSYVSKTTGWQVTTAGHADVRRLFANTIIAEIFEADLAQVFASMIVVPKSFGVLSTAFTCPALSGVGTLTVRDFPSALNMAVYESGDSVRVMTFSRAGGGLTIGDCVGVVTVYVNNADDTQSWTFTRYAGVNGGSIAAATVIAAENVAMDYGTTGTQFALIDSWDGAYNVNGSYFQTAHWTGSPTDGNFIVDCRFGNVGGITGTAKESGVLCGTWATRTSTPVVRMSTAGVDLYGVTLNLYESGTNVVAITPSTQSIALGPVATGVPTACSTGVEGFWADPDCWRVGDLASNYIRFDSTNLKLVSNRLTIDETGVIVATPNAGVLDNTAAFRLTGTNISEMGMFGWRASDNSTVTLDVGMTASGGADAVTQLRAGSSDGGSGFVRVTVDDTGAANSIAIAITATAFGGGTSAITLTAATGVRTSAGFAVDGGVPRTHGIHIPGAAAPDSTSATLYSPDGGNLYYNGNLLATAGVGGTFSGGPLSVNRLPKATAGQVLADSSISDTGSLVSTSVPVNLSGGLDLDGLTSSAATGLATAGVGVEAAGPLRYLPLVFTNAAGVLTGTLNVTSSVTAGSFVGPLTGNASTATALAANPADCAANQFANAINASGTLACAGIVDADVPDSITITLAATATALATARTIGGVSFDGTANIVPTTIVVADTTDTTSYVALWESATGDLLPKTDGGLTYNATTGMLTATGLTGPLTGNAATATALAADPADCAAGQVATGIAASGALSCTATPTVTSLTASGLTAGRVPIVSTAGLLAHDAELLYDATTNVLTAGVLKATNFTVARIPYINASGELVDTAALGFVVGTGTLSATVFSGSGASLTSIPAGQLTGTITSATQDLITRTGTLVAGATGAGFTVALSTSTITGTLADARLEATVDVGALNTTGDLTVGDQLIVSGAGPHAIGGATSAAQVVRITGGHAGSNVGLRVASVLTPAANDDVYASNLGGSVTEAASGTHALIASLRLDAVGVTVGAAAVTNTATLYITNAISATVTGANYALWSVAGANRFGGAVTMDAAATVGTTLGVTGATTLTGLLNANGGIAVDTNFFTVGDGTGSVNTKGYVGSLGFVSQTTGWRCTFLGECDARYLYADELRIKLFSVEEQAVYRASLMVTPSHSEVSQAFTCPATGATATLWVRDAATLADARVFAVSHWVSIRNFTRTDADADGNQELTVGDCVGQVTAYADGSGANAGQQSWTFTRGTALGGSGGTLSTGTVIPVGNAVLDFGVSGNGAVEMNAYDGAEGINAPYLGIKTWTGTPVAANFTSLARLGKLLGITAVAEYGLLAGTYATSSGTFFRASDQNFDLHGITQKFWDGATNVITIAPNAGAPYIGIGNPAPSSCCTTAGIFLGWTSGNVAAFSAYADANNYLTYNGGILTWKAANTTLDASGNLTATSATLSGAITATSGAIGGWVVTADALKDVAGTVGMLSTVTGGDDIRFFAGHATPASAPFRVTEAGALTATSGAIATFTIAANQLSSGTDADYVAMSSGGTNAFWAGDSTFADAEFSVTAAGVLSAVGASIRTSSGLGGRVELTTAGLKGYNAANAQQFSILTDGSGALGTNGIAWTTAGVVTVAGWTLDATTISSTGVTMTSGASAALAFGATPPASCASGTGVHISATALCGVTSGTSQFSLSATTGKATAGAGAVTLDAGGIAITAGGSSTWSPINSYRFSTDADGLVGTYAWWDGAAEKRRYNLLLRAYGQSTGTLGRINLLAGIATGGSTVDLDLDSQTQTASMNATNIALNGAMTLTGTVAFTSTQTMADNQWIGLGASKGRIEFDDQAIDEINILDAGKIGIGVSTPGSANADGSDAVIEHRGTQVGWALHGNRTTDNAVGILAYQNQAIGGSDTRIAQIAGLRSGANNSGALQFTTWSAGTPVNALYIEPTGNVGINCVAPDNDLEIGGTGAGCNTGTGSYINAGSTAFTANSARASKVHITPFRVPDILARMRTVQPSTYDWRDGKGTGLLGLIAEDFYPVLQRGDGKTVNGQDVMMATWLGVQALDTTQQQHARELAALQAEVADLRALVQALKDQR